MQIHVHSVEDIGLALRAVRRSHKFRLDDMADTVGVSKQFVSDLELGKETVRMGLVLKVLADMGLYVSVDIPRKAAQELELPKAKRNGAKVPAKSPRKTPA
jgi:HTH-type transcriptional regulator / antitoxin HipB